MQAKWYATAAELHALGDPCTDADHEAARSSTPYGEAVDLAFEVLNEVRRIEVGTG